MKNMNNNLIHLDNVSAEGKNRIIMYTTARQFKNSVPIEEMLIIPSEIGDWTNYCQITLNNIKLEDLNWRYIYEKYEKMDSLDFMFLDELCNYLDAKAKELILKKYNYDVNKDIR